MRPEIIINPDRFVYFSLGVLVIREPVPQVKLVLESSINSFSNSIFIRVMLCCHADVNVVPTERLNVIWTAILKAAIRVMHKGSLGVFPAFNSLFKRI